MSDIFKIRLPYLGCILFFSFFNLCGQIFTPHTDFGKYISPSVTWGDYDNDGYEDLYICNGGQSGSTVYRWENFLYHNLGNGTFDSISTGALVTDVSASGGSTWGDYDNDGDIDLIVGEASHRQTGSGFSTTYYSKNSFYQNQGNGSFTSLTLSPITDESQSSGFGQGRSRIGPTWSDYNNDGWLDIFESNSTFSEGFTYPHSLYVSDQDGTFSEVTNTLTSDSTGRAGVSWVDFDNDGDLDVATASGKPGKETNLWVNSSGSFTKYNLIASGDPAGRSAAGASWGDYDNDGDFDLFIAITYDSDGQTYVENRLYRNDTSSPDTPIFTEMTSASVGTWIDEKCISYGSAWGDYDNDGDLDLFIGNDGPINEGYSNFLVRNNGNGTFTLVTDGAINDSTFIRSCAWCDYDNDGDLDLAAGREGPNRIFENTGNSNHWLNIKLIDTRSGTNTTAIGSRVRLYAPSKQIREVSAQTGIGGQNSLRTHFGLASVSEIDSVVVGWLSNDGSKGRTETTYKTLPADKFMRYTYGDLDVTASVIKNQTFMYLFGNTGAAVEFTANSDADGGTLRTERFTSAPTNNTFSGGSATAPGGTITPNVVASDRYWQITESGLSGNFTVTLYLDISELAGVNDIDKLVILKRTDSNSSWTPLNTLRIGTTLYASGITSFSQFTIGANSNDNSLPVRLLSFHATVVGGQTQINWQTASEIENLGFILERRASGKEWEEVASYKTYPELKGKGNCSYTSEYRFIDTEQPVSEACSYRLSDVSFAGVKTFLGTIQKEPWEIPKEFFLADNYPNPFNPATTLRYRIGKPVGVKLTIYNMAGRQIKKLVDKIQNSGEYKIVFDASGLSSGVYLYRFQAGKYNVTKKMILLR